MLGNSKVLPLCFAVVLSLAYLSVPGRVAGQAAGSIVGQVWLAPGNAISSPVLVTITNHGAIAYQGYTDNEGRFGVNGLPSSAFHVTINDEAYQPVDREVRIDSITSSSMEMVNIYLVPRRTEKPSELSKVAGGNPQLAGLAQYMKDVPKTVRKEFDKGVKSDHLGDRDEAIGHYQKALKIAPEFYPARNNLGLDYLNQGNMAGAAAEFEHVIKSNPTDAAAYFNSANVFLLTRKYRESLEEALQGLSREPNSAFGHFVLGSAYQRVGDMAQSERALRRALELDRTLSAAHLELVNLYLSQHRKTDAAAELHAFIRDFPNDRNVPKARTLLQKIDLQESSNSNRK
jgi:Flp pilus assembly protein TadD